MLRYPDEIIILKIVGNFNQPDKDPIYEQVYRGRCRVFRDGKEHMKNGKPYICDFKVVLPEQTMTTIGDNYKVAFKYHNSVENANWDVVGRARDFARYDRVCEIYIEQTKENMIYEDMPGDTPAVRNLSVFENDYVRIESVGLRDGQIMIDQEPVNIRLKTNDPLTIEAEVWDPEEFDEPTQVDKDDLPMELDMFARYTNGYVLVTNAHIVGHTFMLKLKGMIGTNEVFTEQFKCMEG